MQLFIDLCVECKAW